MSNQHEHRLLAAALEQAKLALRKAEDLFAELSK